MELDMKLLENILKRVADVGDSGIGPHAATPGLFSDLVSARTTRPRRAGDCRFARPWREKMSKHSQVRLP